MNGFEDIRAAADIESSILIYLLYDSKNNKYKVSYEILSDGWQIVESMVVDEREPIRNDIIKDLENYLNKYRVKIEDAVFQFCSTIQDQLVIGFPFVWTTISSYLAISDEFEQLPNIEVIKHWKRAQTRYEHDLSAYEHLRHVHSYDLFAYEWIACKRSLPQQIIDLMKGSHITTICHLLAQAYESREEYILPLIVSYVPSHTDELVRYDIQGKRPIDLLAIDTQPEVKSIFA